MRCRWLLVSVFMCLCSVAVCTGGCWRTEKGALVLETDEPEYRRAKELIKQGRNQEALAEFENVLTKRGLNNARETHLDMAILYHQHMRDPISAIYHYNKYLTSPGAGMNPPRRNVVLQQIEAAKREYLASMPGRPLLDRAGAPQEYEDTINRLQEQIRQLRAALLAAQSAAGVIAGNATQRGAQQQGRTVAVETPVVVAAADSPFAAQPTQGQGAPGLQPQNPAGVAGVAAAQQQPGRQPAAVQSQPQQQQQARAAQQQQQQAQQAQAAARRHTVRQGDSLYNIARQYYGGSPTNAQVEAIVNANRDQLESRSSSLRPGMVLKIP